jgi:peptide/nickel transport system substrate-binding protein
MQTSGDQIKTAAVGTGPYRLTSYSPGDNYTWERNSGYYEKDVPYIDRIVNKIVVEVDSRVAGLRSGVVHYGWLTADSIRRLINDPNAVVMISPKAWYVHLQMNCSRPPFNNEKVRQAVMWAIDPKEHIDKVAGGQALLTGPVPTGHTDWFIPIDKLPDSLLKVDIPRARQLLAEAGYPNGFKTTAKVLAVLPELVGAAVVAKAQLARIGIDVDVIQMEAGQWSNETQPPTSNYELRTNVSSFYPDADGYMYNHYHSRASNNQVRYFNPYLDEMVTRARQTVNHEVRRRIYFDVQDLLLKEAVVVPLYTSMNLEALSRKIKGYKQSYTGRRLAMARAWLEE